MPTGVYPRKKKVPAPATPPSAVVSRNVVEEVKPDPAAERQTVTEALTKLKEEPRSGPAPKKKSRSQREIEEAAAKAAQEAEYINGLKSDFALFGSVLLDVICLRMPNPIPATPGEKEVFGNATSRLIEKYAPKMAGYEAELAFGLACIVVVAPRLKKPKEELPVASSATS